jgi:hypothetical protein
MQGTAAMYLGTAGGGVWRSTDFTTTTPTWTPLLDHFPPSFLLPRVRGLSNIGALAVDANNPWTIYAGSGDPDDRGPNAYGQGMIKSVDGGHTWKLLDVLPNPFSPGFCRILVDPTDISGDTVYAAGGFGPSSAFRGVFKSSDAGASWSNIQAGMPNNVAVHDIDGYSLSDRFTLFAGITDASGTNPGANGIWVSEDGGASWQQMPLGPLSDLGNGTVVSPSAIGLIKLAAGSVSTSGLTVGAAYAAISNGNRLMNVFKLTFGQWLPVGANGLSAINTTSAQAIGLSPSGEVYVGGVNDARQNGIFRSGDGGASWQTIDVGANGRRPHTDQHAWAFFGGATFNGNDGGVYVFGPNAGSWNDLNTSSLATILTQGVGAHPQSPEVILEGSQDNGVALGTSGQWKYVAGGDAAICKFDPFDPRFAYMTGPSDYHFFFRSDDSGNSFPNDRSVQGKPNVPWYPPFNMHPTQPGRLVLVLDRVYETRNRGDDGWTAISDYLAGVGQFGAAVAYGGEDLVYASMAGRLFQTTDDGVNWHELTPQGGGWVGSITAIAVDPRRLGRVFVGTDGGKIWRSTDGGVSWTDITGTFPNGTLSIHQLAIRSDTASSEPILFAATDVGVWQCASTGPNAEWSRLGDALPDVVVTDIQFNDTTRYLVAGTYGRGVWTARPDDNVSTNVAPGAGSSGAMSSVVATRSDGRIFYNWWQLGQGGMGWRELDGDGRTDAAPAAALVGDDHSYLFVVVKGLNGNLYLNQGQFGRPFVGWEPMGFQSLLSSGAASSGNNAAVVATRSDGRIFYNWWQLGQGGMGWRELDGDGRTDAAPAAALVGDDHSYLFVVVKGLNGNLYLNQGQLGRPFVGWQVLGD